MYCLSSVSREEEYRKKRFLFYNFLYDIQQRARLLLPLGPLVASELREACAAEKAPTLSPASRRITSN